MCLRRFACAFFPNALDVSFCPRYHAELLPGVGRLLCQGHEAALTAQVRNGGNFMRKKNKEGEKNCRTAVNMRQCFHRTTILAAVAFLDAFQKVADMATNSRGEFVFLSSFKPPKWAVKMMMKKKLSSHLFTITCVLFRKERHFKLGLSPIFHLCIRLIAFHST